MPQPVIQSQVHPVGPSSAGAFSFCSTAIAAVALGCFSLSPPTLAQSAVPTGPKVEVGPDQPLVPAAEPPAAGEPTESRPVEQAIVATPSGDRLTVRSGPGASYEIIGSLANGQSLQLSGLTLGNWTQLAGGGWVYVPYLQR